MLSVLVPVFNEEESLEAFYNRLARVVPKLDKDYEIIFIDDGSTDSSFKILKKFELKDKHLRIFSFRRNQGKSEALTLGFQKAKGEYIVTLDADLQDKPEEIVKLLERTKDGCELVCGWRKDRQDPLFKKISSKFFNFIAGVLWGLHLHDYNCGLKVYSREAAQSLRLYGGMHRFIPLLVFQEGFRICEVAVLHEKRRFGKSKYGFSKLWKESPDIFTMIFLTRYGNRPLHFFGTIGGLLLFGGVLVLIYLTFIHFYGQAIGRRPLLFLGILLVLSGFQIVLTGFLADLLINLYHKDNAEFSLKYSSE